MNDMTNAVACMNQEGRFGPEQGVKQDIIAAIAAANYKDNGALFDPLTIAFARGGDFSVVYQGSGDNFIQFLQFNGTRTDGFLPMGDFALTNQGSVERTPIMLVKSDTPGVLAHPTGFNWILDDHGSGEGTDLAYYWPVAPEGYQALGICVGINGAAPDASHYWCVSTSYLQPSTVTGYWSDAGTHWSHDGSLYTPVVGDIRAQDTIVFAPTTLLSAEGGVGQDKSACLVLGKLFLPISGSPAPYPTYDPTFGQGTSTAQGIQEVAVLPCSVISDPLTGSNPQNTPFYYLAGQPYWGCTTAFPSPLGGTYSNSYTIGTSKSESSGFQNTTSVTVGADVGIEAGDAGGFSAHMSVSYTNEMQVSGSVTQGTDTSATQTLTLNLPVAKRVLVWQKTVEFATYRTNGQILAMAKFQTSELDFTDSNPT